MPTIVYRKEKSQVRELAETLLGAVALAALIMIFIARAFTIDGPSMMPTLHHGEKVLVDKLTYRFRPPQRGEIIVFKFPLDPSQHYIKRIIGIPGDTVYIKGGQVIVNGTALKEDFLAEPVYRDFGPYKVPADKYFVLGDNRNNSEDSRSSRVGFVPRRLIDGRVVWRYWPLSSVDMITTPEVFASINQINGGTN